LPPQQHELTPQHQKLDILGELAASLTEEQLQHRREIEINEGRQHSTTLPERTTGRSKTRT
jgi:hypothetical protein